MSATSLPSTSTEPQLSSTLRIAQLSDCHLPATAATDYRGINAYQNLERVLEKVADFAPDLLLATGDLSEDASPSSYHALKDYFDTLDVEVLAIPGNHDEPRQVQEIFPGSPAEHVVVSEHGPWQIVRINSCIEGSPEGRVSSQNLQQLADIFEQTPAQPRLLVLHHQPVRVGSPWIDKYRLQNPEEFLSLVSADNGVKAVLWGHVHQAFAAQHKGTSLLACPSSAINGLPGNEKFTPDPKGPAFRWFELNTDGRFETGIIHA